MNGVLLVGLGGGIGAMARYGVGELVVTLFANLKFPLGTFLVNFLGCFLVGIVAVLAEKSSVVGPNVQLLLITGFLGGFTTFSAFGLDTVNLLRRDDISLAIINIVGSVLCCLVAVWLGLKLGAHVKGA